MADLPSKIDKLLELLEIVATHERISVNALARKLHKKIASIRLYLEYLEELGLIYTEKVDRTTYVNIAADMVAKVGDSMIAVVNGNAIVWRCPFTSICPYYEKGCTTADKCMFLSTFIPAVEEAMSKYSQTEDQDDSQASQEQQQ